MKYWRYRSMIMRLLSFAMMGAAFGCLYLGMAYLSIVFLLFGFHLSTESELSRIRLALTYIMDRQDRTDAAILAGGGTVEKQTKQ